MPPGPVFNWLCVAHSAVEILSQAAHIRATQLSARVGSVSHRTASGKHGHWATQTEQPARADASRQDTEPGKATSEPSDAPHPPSQTLEQKSYIPFDTQSTTATRPAEVQGSSLAAVSQDVSDTQRSLVDAVSDEPASSKTQEAVSDVSSSTAEPAADASAAQATSQLMTPDPSLPDAASDFNLEPAIVSAPTRKLQSSKVPSSRIGRFFHYGGLAASLGYGAASELLRRSTSAEENQRASLMLTEGNIKRLVSKLTQLRGAALKLGQFMSIQDSHILPPEIEDIFRRVQDSAHYMPDWQMEEVLRNSLGASWSDHFDSFDRLPFAAASIGQVHSAVLSASSSPTGRPAKVAVKIQFPNIANSIETDLGYVKMLLTAGRLLPKGLFLDRTIQVMKAELADECDYTREASFLRKFASSSFLGNDSRFKVPWVWDKSTERVLVMEHVDGISVGGSVINSLSQRDRNDIATRVIDLCLKELFAFRMMQTDPNWTNFLWNNRTRQIELVDFGATREYSKEFMDNWLRLLMAAANEDRDACVEWSLKLGYLTGEENEVMLDAHVKSMILLATPFKGGTPQPVSFGPGSQWAAITAEIREQIPVMLKYRLTPPPQETYSLNRKLSGAFLLASRLGASVDCKELWDRVVGDYHFGSES